MIEAGMLQALACAVVASSVMACGEPDSIEALQQRIDALERELADTRAALAAASTPGEAQHAPNVETPAEDLAATPGAADPIVPPQPVIDGAWLPRFLKQWQSSVELGFNGSDGNAQRQNLRLAFKTNRRSSNLDTTLAGHYRLTADHGRSSQSQLLLDARNDWLLSPESRWRYFATGRYEVDQAAAWEGRVSGFGGVGYQIVRGDKTSLLGRGGLGGSKRLGLDDDELQTEGFLAADLTHAVSERQTLRAAVEYLPDTSEWGDYRLNSNASWEVRIDPKSDLFLRVGVANRFDSAATGDTNPHDLDYFVNVGWSF
jgi:putative salt-induced outer membrane protein YdiY